MSKRAFIIHGWDGYPEEGWFPWLKQNLEKRGFAVHVPAMPQPGEPTMKTWVPKLGELVGEPDEHTYLVGHSIGCQVILRYLASLQDKRIGAAVLVAGFFVLRPLETVEEEKILKPWIETLIDFTKIRQATDNITAIFSDNDQWVPLEQNIALFKQNLGDKITVITERNKQHFSGSSGITKLPSALNAILEYDRIIMSNE